MATKVHMEALSPTMEEGQIVRWLKSEGDAVEEGDLLAEIETDKATMELVARGSGVLRKVFKSEGDTAPVGSVIAIVADADEDISGLAADVSESSGAEADEEEPDAKEKESGAKKEVEAPSAGKSEGDGAAAGAGAEVGAGGRIKASPLARKLADEAGLDLGGVQGSGPAGRITKSDIEAAIESGAGAGAPAAAGAGKAGAGGGAAARLAAPAYDGPEVEEVPVSQMRKTIAKRLVTSIGPVPTFYLTVDVDMTRMMEARERMNESLEKEGLKVSVNDLIIKATALALKRHPDVNAQWHEDHIKRFHRVHMGVAVAVEDGLITPIVRDADLKGAARIGAEVRELAGRAREKKLQPDEYTGATFSVSNLGMFGIEEFTAIINPPEAAILAVGAVEERVIVEDGEAMIAPRMKMTMSCDHRVIDGASGARFLQTLTGFLEEPAMALV